MTIKITNCSMGCMYAEAGIDLCQCVCAGKTHGLMTLKITTGKQCSPAVAARCKSGNEGGECHCACEGANHGLYSHLEHFEDAPIHLYSSTTVANSVLSNNK